MAVYNIPQAVYPPHPAGRHTGTIVRVEDKGMVLNKMFNKEEHKIAVFVETDGIARDDGQPWLIQKWFTLSNNPKANLRKFREAVLDRPLSAEELAAPFDDAEIVGRRITYRIDHSEPNEAGQVYGNIREGSVEPVTDNAPQTAPAARQQATGTNRPVGGATAPQRAQAPTKKAEEDSELPF